MKYYDIVKIVENYKSIKNTNISNNKKFQYFLDVNQKIMMNIIIDFRKRLQVNHISTMKKLKEYNETCDLVLRNYCSMDSNGNPLRNSNGTYIIPESNNKECNDELLKIKDMLFTAEFKSDYESMLKEEQSLFDSEIPTEVMNTFYKIKLEDIPEDSIGSLLQLSELVIVNSEKMIEVNKVVKLLKLVNKKYSINDLCKDALRINGIIMEYSDDELKDMNHNDSIELMIRIMDKIK